ncbi:DUF4328 domain-containing protein [Dactylosporangium sp. NPDC050588]|uniref:DUF4328 domain-containing protein n=1 Tax=Dactylosporangium sp. NPDC050588 TaxID=3157211 RepID=UPI0033CA1576
MIETGTAAPHRLATMGWVVTGALGVAALAHAYTIVDSLRGPVAGTGEVVASESSVTLGIFTNADTQSIVLNAARLLVLAALIVWLYLVRDNFDRRDETSVRWPKAFTVAGWFIPVANIVIPQQVVKELYARSNPDRSWTPTGVVSSWWLLLLVSLFASTETKLYADGFKDVHTPVEVAYVTGAAGILAALLAAFIVLRITTWQDNAQP